MYFNYLYFIDNQRMLPSIHLLSRDGQSGGTNFQLGSRHEIGFPRVFNQQEQIRILLPVL